MLRSPLHPALSPALRSPLEPGMGSIWSASYSFALGVLPAAIAALTRGGLATRIGPTGNVEYGAHNFSTESEFRNGLADAPIRDGLLTFSTMVGYAGAVAFGHNGSATSYAYKSFTLPAGAISMSVFVQMDDGAAPTISATAPTASDGSFAFVINNATGAPGAYTIESVGGGIYKVSVVGTSAGAAGNYGVVKYSSNNSRTFKVTGYQFNAGALTAHVPTTTAARFLPRIEHSTTAPHSALGLLVEGQATNEIVSGGLGGSMATQTVTVTAAQRTLHFTGTGTVALSGVATGSLVGTGTGENNRVSLTFTPTAGSLTLTVTGTVTDAQLELGSTRTSVIPTVSSSLVRVGDFSGGGLTGAALTDLITPTSPFTIRFAYRKAYSQASNETLFGLCAGASAGGTNQLQLVTAGTQARLIHSGGSGSLTGTLTHNGTTTNVIAVSVDPTALGAEVITNGGADTDTAWSKGANWTISGGKFNKTAGADASFSQVALTVGKTYRVTFSVDSLSGGTLLLSFGAGNIVATITTAGFYTYTLTCASSTTFVIYGYSATVASIDNISVREAGAMSISVNGGTAVETTGIAYTGAGVTAMVLGARNSAGTDPAVRFTVDPIQSNRRYITGAALQALSV